MRKLLIVSYGRFMKKAVAILGLVYLIITLGTMSSCSSDNDFEESWIGKEHRTRAGIMATTEEENVEILGKRVKPGNVTIHVGEAPGFEAVASWSDGYVGGSYRPQSTITMGSIYFDSNSYGSISSSSYDLRWNGGTSCIEGTITVTGFYIPEHFNYNVPFNISRFVSARVKPTIYAD